MAAELDSATDRINDLLEAAEEGLANLNLAVPASVELREPEPGDTCEHALSFRKSGSGWKLTYDVYDHRDSDVTSKDLLTCSREVRILAVDRLDDLLTALLEAAASQLATVQAKAAKLKTFVQKLPKTKAAKP